VRKKIILLAKSGKKLKANEYADTKSKFENAKNSSSKHWQTAKNAVWGNSENFLDKLELDGKLTRGSRKVSNGLNLFFKHKIQNIVKLIPKSNLLKLNATKTQVTIWLNRSGVTNSLNSHTTDD